MPLETDPLDFLLGDDGDLVVEGGDYALSSGVAGVVQKLRIALNTAMGEWFLNLDRGVPYLPNDVVTESQAILGQRFDEVKARAAFRRAILAEPEVSEIQSLAVAFDSVARKLSVSFRARTIFGDTDTVSVEVG